MTKSNSLPTFQHKILLVEFASVKITIVFFFFFYWHEKDSNFLLQIFVPESVLQFRCSVTILLCKNYFKIDFYVLYIQQLWTFILTTKNIYLYLSYKISLVTYIPNYPNDAILQPPPPKKFFFRFWVTCSITFDWISYTQLTGKL
jgi:hypothetical protein